MKKTIAGLALALICAFACQAHAQETNGIQSDDALAYISLDLDTQGGWVAKVKGGYQWKLFKNAGLEIRNTATGTTLMSRERDFTKSGGAASVSLGYNFSPKIPLTIGLEFGLGPQGKLDTAMRSAGSEFFARQRVRIFTLDLSADYEFLKCARFTPFVGVTGGVAFVSNKAHATYFDGIDTYTGRYGKKSSVNFMAGGRAGVRYKLNERVTLSLYGSYNYLGKIDGKSFNMTGGVNPIQARTQKITAHSLDVKAGLKIAF